MNLSKRLLIILSLLFLSNLSLGKNYKPAFFLDVKNLHFEEKLLVSSLQGTMNKNEPRVFIIWEDDGLKWKNWIQKRFGIKFEDAKTLENLILLSKSSVDGYILWDPKQIETANIATTISGLDNLIVVSPDLENIVKKAGIKKKKDLTEKFRGWSRYKIYKFAYDKLFKKCNKKIVFSSTLPKPMLEIDLTPFLKKSATIKIKFEDRKKDDGYGARLNKVVIESAGKKLVKFYTGSQNEKKYLIDNVFSWFDSYNCRIADANQHFTYEFKLEKGINAKLLLEIENEYLIKIATKKDIFNKVASGEIEDKYYSIDLKTRDYAVAKKAFCMNLVAHQGDKKEFELRDKIIKQISPGGWVLGWLTERENEVEYVDHASKNGSVVMCSVAPNFSFFQWVKPEKVPKLKTPPKPELKNKIYITTTLSDGDSLWADYLFEGRHWDERGKIPYGWEIQPLIWKMAPAIWTYYVETATTNDCFVAAASGNGYFNPVVMPEKFLRMHLQETKKTMEKLGLRVLVTLAYGAKKNTAEIYEDVFKEEYFPGCFDGYLKGVESTYIMPNFIWWGVDLGGMTTSVNEFANGIKEIIAKKKDRPVFIYLRLTLNPIGKKIGPEFMEELNGKLHSELEDEFEIIRPDHFLMLLNDYYNVSRISKYNDKRKS